MASENEAREQPGQVRGSGVAPILLGEWLDEVGDRWLPNHDGSWTKVG